jgi:hypothetical protein
MIKWDLTPSEFAELSQSIATELSLGGNWIHNKTISDGENGEIHVCHGLILSANNFYTVEYHLTSMEVRIFMKDVESHETIEVSNPHILDYTLSKEFVLDTMRKWATSKLSSIEELVDFGIYDHQEYEELKKRLSCLILK